MKVRDRGTAFGVMSKKVAHVVHRVAHVFIIDITKIFRCIDELQRVQKLFRNA